MLTFHKYSYICIRTIYPESVIRPTKVGFIKPIGGQNTLIYANTDKHTYSGLDYTVELWR